MPRRRIKRLEMPRNPILQDVKVLDAFIKEGFEGGKSATQMLLELLPSAAEQQKWKLEQLRERRDEATAKRAAHQAALDDPAKREAERQRFQAKLRVTQQKNAARDRRHAAEAQAKAAALAENPTLAWRHPRRKGWTPDAGYATGSRRKNKRRDTHDTK